MPDYLSIHDFAVRYQKLYENRKTTETDVSENVPEQCFALGFDMDCGKRFMDSFQNAPFYNSDGDILSTHGALISGHQELDALSALIRRNIGECALFVFNGCIPAQL